MGLEKEGYSYTDEQAEAFDEFLFPSSRGRSEHGHIYLRRLHEAGITVTFPQPRYYAQSSASPDIWFVLDTMNTGIPVATFRGLYAEQYAKQHADRLNREDIQ